MEGGDGEQYRRQQQADPRQRRLVIGAHLEYHQAKEQAETGIVSRMPTQLEDQISVRVKKQLGAESCRCLPPGGTA